MNENELMNEAARELNEINESDVVNVTAQGKNGSD